MPIPRELNDALESVLGIYFSGIRHRERAAFILCDELIEMACKLKARDHNPSFNMRTGFHGSWNAPGVAIPRNPLGDSIQANRNTRNTMQHGSAAATVDDQHCADSILDAVRVLDHCWPGSVNSSLQDWIKCALRVIKIYSSEGYPNKKQAFEDEMRDEKWRVDTRPPKVNEVKIRPGLRFNWGLVFRESSVQVDQILNRLGIPS